MHHKTARSIATIGTLFGLFLGLPLSILVMWLLTSVLMLTVYMILGWLVGIVLTWPLGYGTAILARRKGII